MDNVSQNGSTGSANNSSSDFVRKLYKMLEDPSYDSVVRWGDNMDSFVVLENERFTKSILPKHFKHSNFASFVRQLNKYDFHKVRHNNEENGASPYGPGAWEFRHPDFKANNKDALDNIRRKAPAPRKPQVNLEDGMPTQQMDLVNTQLVATQQQLRHLEERYNELSMHHGMLLQELIGVQKTVVNHEHVMQNVMNFLHSVDAKHRRDSRVAGPFATPGSVNGNAANAGADVARTASNTNQSEMSSWEDLPASPLANASKLLNEFNADLQLNYKNLEHMNEMHTRTLNITTPPPDAPRGITTGHRGPSSAASSASIPYAKLSDLDNMVYPVGQTNGIDPMYSEHIHNIPYAMPPKEAAAPDPRQQFAEHRKRSTQVDPGWVRPPQILLVEDDPTCRRIGSKFLYSFHCAIDSAFDGLEAVNKINSGSKYDLILMDIIMPNLDGVSACHLIRQVDTTPIIAMTSNIRSDDISMYFQHGMNDVLPKPFTKEGLLNMLEKHLGHMKKLPDGFEVPPHTASTVGTQPSASGGINTGPPSIKDEVSPGASPSTVSNWASPSGFTGISPRATAAAAAGPGANVSAAAGPSQAPAFMSPVHAAGFGVDSNGLAYSGAANAIGGSGAPRMAAGLGPGQRRPLGDMGAPGLGDDLTGHDSKRPRVFATTNAAMSSMRRV